MRNNEMNEEAAIPENSKAVIQPEGDLVSISLPPLRSKMREMVGAGVRHLTVDLAKVQMVDSAGLGLLMSAHNSLRKTGGQLAVIHASEDILQLFQTMRFHQHFSVSGD
jgi:anti-anti-sigma factor